MATIDVAMESSVQAVKTVADNIYTKVDTEVASINTTVNNIYSKVDTEIDTLTTNVSAVNTNVSNVKTVADNIYAKVDTELQTVDDNVDAIKTATATNNTASKTGTLSQKESYAISLLENATYGLSALQTKLSSGMSAVKSVQRGIVAAGQSKSGTETFNLGEGSNYKYAYYIDVTISAVSNINKCQVNIQTVATDSSYTKTFVGKLTSSTNLRVYYYGASSSSNNVVTSSAFTWEVTEFA